MTRWERWVQALAHRENTYTTGATIGLSFTALPVLVSFAQAIPTLPPAWMWLHVLLVTLAGWACYQLSVPMMASMLSLFRLPVPRLLTASLLCFGLGTYFGWAYYAITPAGALVVTAIYIMIGISSGSAIAAILRVRRGHPFTAVYALLAATATISAVLWMYGPGGATYPPGSAMASGDRWVEALDLENPGEAGTYLVDEFTYGSGVDRYRKEFAEDADLVSPTVDASAFVEKWHRLRQLYWGFGPKTLPLNGRVWMPQGEGPFPLALIVHGNHNMEQFSDPGYAYLGEQLASRGIITVSVDENFINYSNWSGGVEPDMTLRAWVLLEHLQWIAKTSNDPGTPFSGKVDADRVALMGHSRGGQAATLAASFTEFFNDAEEVPLPDEPLYTIQSVVAIAPIDRAIDKQYVRLRDVNYMVLQGAMDGDVNVFYGHRQYSRIRWNEGSSFFKTALYIEGANHGQFNTTWGGTDIAAPLHLLLNRKDMLDGEDQRSIAKLYVSAFLETTLKGKEQYMPMFQDHRYAIAWLPDASYLQQYEDSGFEPVVRYDEDENKQTTAVYGGKIAVTGMEQWREDDLEDREGDSLFNDAVYLSWDGKGEAVYEIDLREMSEWVADPTSSSWIGFDLANANLDPEKRDRVPPPIELEIETVDGKKRSLRLDQYKAVPRAIHTRFTKSVFFEEALRKGNLGNSAEATLQTFLIPLTAFELSEVGGGDRLLTRIRFIFPKGKSGRMILDNIGWYPQGPLGAVIPQ